MTNDECYWIKKWGSDYYDVNPQGHVMVRPTRDGHVADLYELVTSLVEQGIEAPILIRFGGVIRDRIQYLSSSFQTAIEEFNWGKLTLDTPSYIIESDASIVAPLVFQYVLES